MKVKFPQKIGTAQINLVVNDLSLIQNFSAGTLHFQCLAASGLSQERSWIVVYYHVST